METYLLEPFAITGTKFLIYAGKKYYTLGCTNDYIKHPCTLCESTGYVYIKERKFYCPECLRFCYYPMHPSFHVLEYVLSRMTAEFHAHMTAPSLSLIFRNINYKDCDCEHILFTRHIHHNPYSDFVVNQEDFGTMKEFDTLCSYEDIPYRCLMDTYDEANALKDKLNNIVKEKENTYDNPMGVWEVTE